MENKLESGKEQEQEQEQEQERRVVVECERLKALGTGKYTTKEAIVHIYNFIPVIYLMVGYDRYEGHKRAHHWLKLIDPKD